VPKKLFNYGNYGIATERNKTAETDSISGKKLAN